MNSKGIPSLNEAHKEFAQIKNLKYTEIFDQEKNIIINSDDVNT